MSSEKLNVAINSIRAGNESAAMRVLAEIVTAEPNNETAWLWLSICVEEADRKKYCLKRALAINPDNWDAKNAFAQVEELPRPSLDELMSSTAVSRPPESPPSMTAITDECNSQPTSTPVTFETQQPPGPQQIHEPVVPARSVVTPVIPAPSTAPLPVDCGLPSGILSPTHLPMRTPLPIAAGILYLLLAAYVFIVGSLQILLPFLGLIQSNSVPVGLWNILMSIFDMVVAAFIFRRAYRGYDWGLGTAILSIPAVLLTGGLSCLTMPLLLGFLMVGVLLWMSKSEFSKAKTRP